MDRRDTVAAGGLTRLAALAAVGAVLGASAIVGRRNAPDRAHPGIRRWYRRLDKPGYTPPGAAFGAVWPVLETGLAVGGYRLLRRTPRRIVTKHMVKLRMCEQGGQESPASQVAVLLAD